MKEKFEIIVNDCVDDIAPQCCFSPVADFNLNFLSRVRMMHGIDIPYNFCLYVRPSVWRMLLLCRKVVYIVQLF